MVVQKPGAVVHAASSPASVRPATSPWASASPQCSTRRRRPARACRAAAMSPTASTAGSELRIEASTGTAPSWTSSPASAASRTRGAHAGAEHHEVGRQGLAALPAARASAARCAWHLGAEADLDAGLAEQRRDELARRARPGARPAGAPRARRGRPSSPRRASDAAASQAMKPAPTTTARAPGRAARAQAQGVVDRADGVQAGILGAVDRRALGRRAGGEHAGVVGQLLAALEVHAARRAVESDRRAPAAQRHGVGGEPRLVLERQLGGLELAAQQLLGQRRAAVGEVRLGAHDVHCGLAAGFAVAARGAQRRRAAPDDDDPLLGRHASKTSIRKGRWPRPRRVPAPGARAAARGRRRRSAGRRSTAGGNGPRPAARRAPASRPWPPAPARASARSQ